MVESVSEIYGLFEDGNKVRYYRSNVREYMLCFVQHCLCCVGRKPTNRFVFLSVKHPQQGLPCQMRLPLDRPCFISDPNPSSRATLGSDLEGRDLVLDGRLRVIKAPLSVLIHQGASDRKISTAAADALAYFLLLCKKDPADPLRIFCYCVCYSYQGTSERSEIAIAEG